MTVFGARDQQQIGGKPRHFGLMLAAILLLFLAAVAAWASIFLEDGVAGLFRETPAKTEVAAVPDTPRIGEVAQDPTRPETSAKAVPTPPPPQIGSQEPTTLALLPPASIDIPNLPPPSFVTQPAPPPSPDLTDTDSAVLDALRQPAQPAETTAEPADPIAEPVAEPTPDPASPPGAFVTSGLQKTAPRLPETPSIIGLDNLYIASIDRTDLSQDAVALPTVASLITDLPLGAVRSPLAAGTEFELGPRGLVEATVEGTLNPGGILVYLGRPPAVPPVPPVRGGDTAADGTSEIAAAPPNEISRRRPRARPTDLAERFERSNLGGMSRAELKQRRPKARPESRQEQIEPDAAPTAQAVVSSSVPRARPRNFAAIVSAAIRPAKPEKSDAPSDAPVAAAAPPRQNTASAPQSSAPNIPSSASVARQATLKNEINLRRVNLIGVYGTPSNRRALVRLPSGRYKKVKVGDSVDGGRVVAIGDSELRYQKKGRNMILKIPSS